MRERGLDLDAESALRVQMLGRSGSRTPSTPPIAIQAHLGVEQPPHRQVFTLHKDPHTCMGRGQRAWRRHVRISSWIGNYNGLWCLNDLIAGITLGLTIIPESIACALLAGLPASYGLCSAFIGPFIYLFFGSIDNVIIGPTSLVALASVQFTIGKPIEFAFLLTFLSGIVELVMGLLQLGFVFEFISMPVIKAFSSAVAFLVIESQIKVLLGIKYLVADFVDSVKTLSARLPEARFGDLIMGLSAIVFLIIFEQFERLALNPKIGRGKRIFYRYLSFSRNTLIVLITASISYVWLMRAPSVPFALSKNALSGLPNFTLPAMTVQGPERSYDFWEIMGELNVGIVVIPILGMLTNISIGKLSPAGIVDTNHELLVVGLCNIFGACVQAMPTSGAFTRYAISKACNLRTPMANLYLGIVVLLALSYLSPYFNYIPEPTLAAILICSIYTLLDFQLPRRLWRESKRDFGIWVLCFSASILFGVEVGLFVSIIVAVLHLLYLWARPDIHVKIQEVDEMQYISVTPGNGIYFPAINHLREKVLKACAQAEYKIPVVIDCQKVTGLDFTAAQGISRLSTDLGQGDTATGALLILFRMQLEHQKLIDITENLVFCESADKMREFLTQEALRNGFINLKEHIRASIDLGYKIEMD